MTLQSPPKKSRPRTAKPAPRAVVYPPGFFTEPVRAWKALQWQGPVAADADPAAKYVALAKRGRVQAAKTGKGWGRGTIVLPNTPKHPAPEWIDRAG